MERLAIGFLGALLGSIGLAGMTICNLIISRELEEAQEVLRSKGVEVNDFKFWSFRWRLYENDIKEYAPSVIKIKGKILSWGVISLVLFASGVLIAFWGFEIIK